MSCQQKTLPDAQAATGFLKTIESEKRRSESAFLMEMMERLTGSQPELWGRRSLDLASITTNMTAAFRHLLADRLFAEKGRNDRLHHDRL